MDDLRLQDPDAVLDHPIDWSDWLATGETITAFTPTITPSSGVTLSDDDIDAAADGTAAAQTTVTVAGLTHGTIYRLAHAVTTSAGREDVRSLTIRGAKL